VGEGCLREGHLERAVRRWHARDSAGEMAQGEMPGGSTGGGTGEGCAREGHLERARLGMARSRTSMGRDSPGGEMAREAVQEQHG